MFHNMSVRLKIGLAFTLALIFILTVSVFSISNIISIQENIETLLDFGGESSQLDSLQQIFDRSVLMIVILTGIISVLGFFLSRIISKSVVRPISIIAEVASEMSQGNLHNKLEYQSNNELGKLADAVRNSMDTLAKYIGEIDRLMSELASGNFETVFEHSFIGDFINIEHSIKQFSEKMNNTLSQIDIASSHCRSSTSLRYY